MTEEPIAPNENAIREFVETYQRETGRPPSGEEIAFYFATQRNSEAIARLEQEGLLEGAQPAGDGIRFRRAAMKALRNRL